MKVWIKLVKHFQGGSKEDYMFVEKSDIDTNDKEETLMEYWGENSDGGHAYGYHVHMSELEENEFPPLEWIEKKLLSNESDIDHLKLKINAIHELNIELLKLKIKML
jgi:hypothetical protein